MNEKLIINNTNDNNNINNNINSNNNNNNAEQEQLMKEIKKMFYIKYFIVLFSIIRFVLMFFILVLLPYFPKSFRPNLFNALLFLYTILFLPILTINLLIVAVNGTIRRDFWVKKKKLNFGFYSCFCCCCIMLKNVSYLKIITLTNGFIQLVWFVYILYYFVKDYSNPNTRRFFPYSSKRVIYKLILIIFDSITLLLLCYFFYYSEYFLKKVEKYLEFYKRLIIKNRNKEAEFVRNTLPAKVEDYISDNPSEGSELQNI